ACTDVDQLSLMPAVARAFSKRLPRAVLHVMSVDHLESLGGLARAEVDAALAPPLPPTPGLHAARLYEDEAVLVVRRGHPAARGPMTRERFNALRHIDIRVVLGERGQGNRMAEAMLRRHGLVRDIAAIVPGFSAALMLAASTDLVAGVPRRIASALADALSLKLIDVPGPPLRFPMQLVWHERTHADAGSRCFRELILEVAAGAPRA
ncbi:MAG TPA: LysR substrate-binding domain-containing protein, partial [Aggregicoccus sp.]|nr:LysR substrate-binding domain-containing protein [Aggregicoccus sp.]